MNRWDEIQACARDIASNVHDDPERITAMADDLIKLCGLMIAATGKVVAGQGESAMCDLDDDGEGYAVYRAGESMQTAAQEAVDESSSSGCDLERWSDGRWGEQSTEGWGWSYQDRRPAVLRDDDDATAARAASGRVLRTLHQPGTAGVAPVCAECHRCNGHKMDCSRGRRA